MPSILVKGKQGEIVINKEEILSRSRLENKNKDLYSEEVKIQAGSFGSLVASLLATVLFVTQVVIGDEFDFGLYAVIFSVSASSFIYRIIRLKRRRDVILAVIYTLATLALSAAHIIQLLRTHTDYLG
ncbi:DUF6442 family protein [Paenibacillus daejeonensis]|uniref:DUF6442 family protein n=1 Tax=Paenibacillus daejeonensis TaxID=135193 RepID=UPI000378EC04|nr:DUF6442 family protein [Paenibacillus daejeonensis]